MTRKTTTTKPVRVGPAALLRLLAGFAGLGALVALVTGALLSLAMLGFQMLGADSGDAERQQEIRRQVDACEYSRQNGGPGC